MLAQLLGAFLAAAILYANYFHAIDAFEGKGVRTVSGTAGLFATYAVCPFKCLCSLNLSDIINHFCGLVRLYAKLYVKRFPFL